MMTGLGNKAVLTVLGVLLLVLGGCGSTFPVKTYTLQVAPAREAMPVTGDVALIDRGTSVDRPFTVLGKVMTSRWGDLGPVRELDDKKDIPENMKETLMAAARTMGAQAVQGVYFGEYQGVKTGVSYASGLAVDYGVDTDEEDEYALDFKVGILPVQIGDSDMSRSEYSDLDRDLRAGARWFLEDKGYYAPVDMSVNFTGTADDLMDPLVSEDAYGEDTELLLLIELMDETSQVADQIEVQYVALNVSLFSKSMGKVIWQNHMPQGNVSAGFGPGLSKPALRAGAMEEMLKPLPYFARIGTREFVAFPPDMLKRNENAVDPGSVEVEQVNWLSVETGKVTTAGTGSPMVIYDHGNRKKQSRGQNTRYLDDFRREELIYRGLSGPVIKIDHMVFQPGSAIPMEQESMFFDMKESCDITIKSFRLTVRQAKSESISFMLNGYGEEVMINN